MLRITGLWRALTATLATPKRGRSLGWIGMLAMIGGGIWLAASVHLSAAPTEAAFRARYTMDDARFRYSPGWQVDASGADPPQPADPWSEPAGVLTFDYTGRDLWLQLAVGDYWGYFYVTVDGKPANQLAVIAGNLNSAGVRAGYKTFYEPERQTANGPGVVWFRVHHAAANEHEARVEIWRSWGQRPLRGVAVDATTASWPQWPGALLLVVGVWLGVLAWRGTITPWLHSAISAWGLRLVLVEKTFASYNALALPIGLLGLLVTAVGTAGNLWWLALAGLAVLGVAALARPALWPAALLLGLPFYFTFPLPVLPGRALSLIDVGLLGGLALVLVQWLLRRNVVLSAHGGRPSSFVLWALIGWAFVAAMAAAQQEIALREWRVVFLAAGLFALVWHGALLTRADERLLVGAWLGGGALVALVGLWQYANGAHVISAEGVWRVRAFYGSPNNLALYLDRTLAVTLALAFFGGSWRGRLGWGLLALLQGAALLLTFSKGALLLALPAMLVTLWLGGLVLLRRQGRSPRLLWGLAIVGGVVFVALLPFLGAERFQRLLDFSQGTGFLRLNLWRSAWQMALDHPWFGVGPDNFLYAYRSTYILPAAWQEPNLNHPHNIVLDWWTRLGLVGLLSAVTWFAMIFLRLWYGVRQGDRPVLQLGLLAAMAAALAHGLIDASYALPDLMLVWVLILLLAEGQEVRSQGG